MSLIAYLIQGCGWAVGCPSCVGVRGRVGRWQVYHKANTERQTIMPANIYICGQFRITDESFKHAFGPLCPAHAHGEHANCTQNNKSYKHIGSLKVENLADIQNKMVCGNQNHPPLEGWILNHTKN